MLRRMFPNIPQHQSLEELSLSLASSWLSLYQLHGVLVGQFQLSRQSFADQLEVICEHELSYSYTMVLLVLGGFTAINP